jgi:hypothetical protein
MHPSIGNRNAALSPVDPRRLSIPQIAICLLGFLLTAFVAQADSVTVNLGQSAQSFTMAGTGPNSSGLGQYVITMGACSSSGGNTTCTISGSFTGSTPGFTDGTYSLVTTYVGTGSTPFQGVEQAAGSNYFAFSSAPQTATMTLNLTTSTGTVVAPMLVSSQFVTGASFSLLYTGSATCSGTAVPSCSVAQVGVAAGSSITGPVTGTATFAESSRSYYFPHLTFGGGYQSTLTYVNYSPQTVTCVTNFYTDSGGPLSIPFSLGTISSRTDAMPPGQIVHDQSVADLSAIPIEVEGWAKATCSGPVQASALFRYFLSGAAQGEAGVNAETAPTTKFATFAQTNTGVAYANPSPTESATVTLTVIGANGTRLGSTAVTLAPLGHGAVNPGPLLSLGSFKGMVEITSSIPIVSLSINAEAFPVFSSLPPGDLPDSTALVSP